MIDSAAPPFLVHTIWHSGFPEGDQVANMIRAHFGTDRLRSLAGGAGIEFLHSELSPTARDFAPIVVDWNVSCPVAVVVLIDRSLAGSSEAVRYIRDLGEQANAFGFDARLLPVVMESDVIDDLGFEEQAIRWDQWGVGSAARKRRLLRELAYEFARMVRYHLHGREAGYGTRQSQLGQS